MQLWQWLLIDIGILGLGGVWLATIIVNLARVAKRAAADSADLIDALSKLQAATSTESSYSAPKTNLEDSAFEKTEQLLARLRRQEKKREAKKRRLIARFSERK